MSRRHTQRPEAGEFSTEAHGQAIGPEGFSPPLSRSGPLRVMRNHTDQQIAELTPAPELSRPLDEDALLTDAEVSEMLGNIPRSTLRAWRTRGFGPRFIRLAPRTPRYRLRDVRAWIASRTEGVQP